MPSLSIGNQFLSDPLPLSSSVSNDEHLFDPNPEQGQEQQTEHWAPQDLPEYYQYGDGAVGIEDHDQYQSDSWRLMEEDANPYDEETHFEPADPLEDERVDEDPNNFDIWVNNDQEIEASDDLPHYQYYEHGNSSHDLEAGWNDFTHNDEAVFDDTFFSTPSLQVLQFDEGCPCEEAEEEVVTSHRPPRPKQNIGPQPPQDEERQWAWSSDSQPSQKSVRSAYSYSTNHLPLVQSSRPQTAADPSRPLHLTDTVDDGDEPYEITFSTPATLLPRISSPIIPTSRTGSSQMKRPHSLPNGLIAATIH